MYDFLNRKENETVDEWLLRVGELKASGLISLSWLDLAEMLNDGSGCHSDESSWRKRYYKLSHDKKRLQKKEAEQQNTDDSEPVIDKLQKQRILLQQERTEAKKRYREYANYDAIAELFSKEIKRFDHVEKVSAPKVSEKVVIAMLSDIHFGIEFHSSAGEYSPSIAKKRVMQYAEEVIRIGQQSGAQTCAVMLMGDLISGNIHIPLRIENRENIVAQIVGVSELIAAFLKRLSEAFEVCVHWVDGNHSRIEPTDETALRTEKLDSLIPWYCKCKLEQIPSVSFAKNMFDSSIAVVEILGKTYVIVHGDYDSDLKTSAMRIERLLKHRIDYLLAGHMHVPDCRIEDIGFIRNGCVCGSGDNYTMKKRLFSPPYQVCLTASSRGVEGIYPVRL